MLTEENHSSFLRRCFGFLTCLSVFTVTSKFYSKVISEIKKDYLGVLVLKYQRLNFYYSLFKILNRVKSKSPYLYNNFLVPSQTGSLWLSDLQKANLLPCPSPPVSFEGYFVEYNNGKYLKHFRQFLGSEMN